MQACEQQGAKFNACTNKSHTGCVHHNYDMNRVESTTNVIYDYDTNPSYDLVMQTINPAYAIVKPEMKNGDNCCDTNPDYVIMKPEVKDGDNSSDGYVPV